MRSAEAPDRLSISLRVSVARSVSALISGILLGITGSLVHPQSFWEGPVCTGTSVSPGRMGNEAPRSRRVGRVEGAMIYISLEHPSCVSCFHNKWLCILGASSISLDTESNEIGLCEKCV